MKTIDRIPLLAEICTHPLCIELLGSITAKDLSSWLRVELGRADALDSYASIHHSDEDTPSQLKTRACAPSHILHIVSGNTPHAAFQSLIRALLLGSRSVIKLPSSGLAELTEWISTFPSELNGMIETTSQLTEQHWLRANAVIAIGSDDTIAAIYEHLRPDQIFIPHGHKLSIGIIESDFKQAALLAARDTSLYNQRGCLSPHAFYLPPSEAKAFAELLAEEMQHYATEHPPEPLNLSEAGAIRNLRETTRFKAANITATNQLWESPSNLDWTVIYDSSSELALSCTNCCIYVRPIPDGLLASSNGTEAAQQAQETQDALGPEAHFLSTVSLHPYDHDRAAAISDLLPTAHRICPLGQAQKPSLFWHHDGFAPLLSLVKWKDIG